MDPQETDDGSDSSWLDAVPSLLTLDQGQDDDLGKKDPSDEEYEISVHNQDDVNEDDHDYDDDSVDDATWCSVSSTSEAARRGEEEEEEKQQGGGDTTVVQWQCNHSANIIGKKATTEDTNGTKGSLHQEDNPEQQIKDSHQTDHTAASCNQIMNLVVKTVDSQTSTTETFLAPDVAKTVSSIRTTMSPSPPLVVDATMAFFKTDTDTTTSWDILSRTSPPNTNDSLSWDVCPREDTDALSWSVWESQQHNNNAEDLMSVQTMTTINTTLLNPDGVAAVPQFDLKEVVIHSRRHHDHHANNDSSKHADREASNLENATGLADDDDDELTVSLSSTILALGSRACTVCTLLNKPTATICEACGCPLTANPTPVADEELAHRLAKEMEDEATHWDAAIAAHVAENNNDPPLPNRQPQEQQQQPSTRLLSTVHEHDEEEEEEDDEEAPHCNLSRAHDLVDQLSQLQLPIPTDFNSARLDMVIEAHDFIRVFCQEQHCHSRQAERVLVGTAYCCCDTRLGVDEATYLYRDGVQMVHQWLSPLLSRAAGVCVWNNGEDAALCGKKNTVVLCAVLLMQGKLPSRVYHCLPLVVLPAIQPAVSPDVVRQTQESIQCLLDDLFNLGRNTALPIKVLQDPKCGTTTNDHEDPPDQRDHDLEADDSDEEETDDTANLEQHAQKLPPMRFDFPQEAAASKPEQLLQHVTNDQDAAANQWKLMLLTNEDVPEEEEEEDCKVDSDTVTPSEADHAAADLVWTAGFDSHYQTKDQEDGAGGPQLFICNCEKGKYNEVKQHLDHYPRDVHYKDMGQRTALHIAAASGHLAVLKLLVETGGDMWAKDSVGKTPLDDAVASQQDHVIDYLLAKQVAPSLQAACRNGNVGMLKAHLEKADHHCTRIPNKEGQTLLHLASMNGHLPVVERLLTCGACEQDQDADGRTALDLARLANHNEVAGLLKDFAFQQGVSLLLMCAQGDLRGVQAHIQERPQDVNFANSDVRTPLHLAAEGGHLNMVKFLVQEGAHRNIRDTWGRTPLDSIRWVCLNCEDQDGRYGEVLAFLETGFRLLNHVSDGELQDVVDHLTKHPTDVHFQDPQDLSPLHVACSTGHDEIAAYLLQLGANPAWTDRENHTALDHAVRSGHPKVAARLRTLTVANDNETRLSDLLPLCEQGDLEAVKRHVAAYPNDATKADCKGLTALHSAALVGNVDIVKFLLSEGANVDATDRWGVTPLVDATRMRHTKVVSCLQEWQTGLKLMTLIRENAKPPEIEQHCVDYPDSVCFVGHDQRTPLDAATAAGRQDVVGLLLRKLADRVDAAVRRR